MREILDDFLWTFRDNVAKEIERESRCKSLNFEHFNILHSKEKESEVETEQTLLYRNCNIHFIRFHQTLQAERFEMKKLIFAYDKQMKTLVWEAMHFYNIWMIERITFNVLDNCNFKTIKFILMPGSTNKAYTCVTIWYAFAIPSLRSAGWP